MKQHAPATERNRDPIYSALRRVVPDTGLVLEIASGSGEHAVAFARLFPGVTWQPSDADPTALASIRAYRDEAALPNLAEPLSLDVTKPWPIDRADVIVCINMVHISPWESALALFENAGRIADILVMYGPYAFDGELAPSNAEFDRSLRARDPRWGVRDVADLKRAAQDRNLDFHQAVAMPANNHVLVFRRRVV